MPPRRFRTGPLARQLRLLRVVLARERAGLSPPPRDRFSVLEWPMVETMMRAGLLCDDLRLTIAGKLFIATRGHTAKRKSKHSDVGTNKKPKAKPK